MREPKNQMLGTMEPPLMQLSVNLNVIFPTTVITKNIISVYDVKCTFVIALVGVTLVL